MIAIITNKIINKAHKIISHLESLSLPPFNYCFTFLCLITLRSFIEMFSDTPPSGAIAYAHYYSSYILLAMLLTIVFHITTSEKIENIAKIIIPGFTIILLPPVIDLFLCRGYNISYIMPELHDNVFERYLTFFGSFDKGASPGIRIEIIIAMMGSMIYFSFKKVKPLANIAAVAIIYSVIYWWGASPFC